MPEYTIAERLLYSTVKLTALKNNVPISTGTGFFMIFAQKGTQIIPAIVTNKHVLSGADQILAVCHIADGLVPSGKFVECKIFVTSQFCVEHPKDEVDLCAILIADIMNQASSNGTPIFLQWIDQSIIPTDDDWKYFDAIEEVTMVGCPNGISDQVNNIPIIRRGITATPLSMRYNGKNEFMVDMACFPGSSGSPVFIYDRNGFLDRKNSTYNFGEQRILFVGILYAGPQISNKGQIILGQVPRVTFNSMMHLGNVIRSTEILTLDAELRKKFNILDI